MPYKKISAIYKITNNISKKVYIGSAINVYHRFSTHRSLLRSSKHFNKHLQSAWNKYGENSFMFEIIENCLPEDLLDREEYYIKLYKSNDRNCGYNRRHKCISN